MEKSGLKSLIVICLFIGVIVGAALIGYRYYSYIFAKKIDGRVVAVSRVVSEVEGYVVAIQVAGQGILTARTDDPRWALVKIGQCAQAKFFPHPPWNLSDAGTFFRATLLLIRDCTPEEKAAANEPAPLTPAADVPETTAEDAPTPSDLGIPGASGDKQP